MRYHPSMRTNAGEQPTALWISRVMGDSGARWTDKLTPDGLLCGFAHSDTSRAVEPLYSVEIGEEPALAILLGLCSPDWEALDSAYQGDMEDGFSLHLQWRLDGGETHGVWMCNVLHPLIASLVREVWKHVPPSGRSLPELPAWRPE
jgi:hypothetical protein